jgi:hypothetical protein
MIKKTNLRVIFQPLVMPDTAVTALSPAFLVKLRRRLKRVIKKELAKTSAEVRC